MGILSNILRRTQESTNTLPGPSATGASLPTTLRSEGNAILGRASQFYRDNPKKVQALGLVAAALLLKRVQRGRS
jgi:hypothetical protein